MNSWCVTRKWSCKYPLRRCSKNTPLWTEGPWGLSRCQFFRVYPKLCFWMWLWMLGFLFSSKVQMTITWEFLQISTGSWALQLHLRGAKSLQTQVHFAGGSSERHQNISDERCQSNFDKLGMFPLPNPHYHKTRNILLTEDWETWSVQSALFSAGDWAGWPSEGSLQSKFYWYCDFKIIPG